jgi:type I restriction enzyme, S subunit
MSRYKAYPAYRDTETKWLGVIPSNWNLFDGKRLFSSRRESAREGDEQLAASQKYGVVPQSLMMEMNDAKVMLALKGTSSFRHVGKNDFVISLRSFEGGIEHSSYVGCVSPAYTVLQAEKAVVPAYFKYLLKSGPYIAALQASTDSLRDGKSISYEQFGAIALPYPVVDEQAAIAAFLDHETAKIDALIEKQQRLIELLKEKRRAVISHAVTKGLNPNAPMKDSGVEWLGEVPAHWALLRVKFVCSFTTSGPRGWSEQVGETGSLFIQSGDLSDTLSVNFSGSKRVQIGNDAEAKRTALRNGDVVVCITGAKTGNVGLCDVVPEDAYINQHLCLIRPTSIIASAFLAVQLKSSLGQTYFELSQYGLKQGLSLENVREAPVLVPPVTEQSAIVSYLNTEAEKFDVLSAKAQHSKELLQERRTALISAAVTGKIDVRDWQAAA